MAVGGKFEILHPLSSTGNREHGPNRLGAPPSSGLRRAVSQCSQPSLVVVALALQRLAEEGKGSAPRVVIEKKET